MSNPNQLSVELLMCLYLSKMKNLFLVCIAALLLFANDLSAQQRQTHQDFYIQTRIVDGKPLGKIIPGNQAAWYLGMTHGYTVSVATMVGNDYGPYEVVVSNLMPGPASAFDHADLSPTYADAMRSMIYEADYTAPGTSFDDMLLADKVMGRMHFSYLLLTSYDPLLSQLSGLQFDLPKNLGERFKVKVTVNEYPSYSHEQILLGGNMYTDTQSPSFEITPGDQVMTLQWSHHDYKLLFVAYQVERSTNGQNFESLGAPRIFNGLTNAGQLGMISYVDSLPKNYSDYWYRVRGYDVFGILSKPGEAIQVSGIDMTPPKPPTHVHVEQVAPSVVNVTWAHEPATDLKGFQVIGSMTPQGEYQRLHETLLGPRERFFQFDISEYLFRYYRILAVDTAKNASASDLAYLVVVDTVPPEVPTDLRVEIDSNRVVKLSWSASTSEDIKGYRLMKAYHPSQGFVPITPKPVSGLSFIDSIPKQRIDRKVYYQLIALDRHFNHSAPAPFVAAPIPDHFPPTPPLLTHVERLESGEILLKWNPSSSDDVASYKIVRTIDSDSTVVEIPLTSSDVVKHIDPDLKSTPFLFATYAVAAIDSSGNVSNLSNAKRVFSFKNQDNTGIAIGNLRQVDSAIQLEWDYSSATAHSVLIYRKEGDKGYDLLGRTNSGNLYVDSDIKPGIDYAYKIGVMETTGRKSPLSKPVSIKVK